MERNIELEYKFDAASVDLDHLDRVMQSVLPEGFKRVETVDTFYRRGDAVVRHRVVNGQSKELTIKARKSTTSLRERVEVNLRISSNISEDVRRFMGLAGFECHFSLRKPQCLIWEFHDIAPGLCDIEVAYYEVAKVVDGVETDPRKFIEVEVQGSLPDEEAKVTLDHWAQFLQETLHLGEPINLSLYEHYSKE